MPIISQFYGINIKMFNEGNTRHHIPHIHVEYGEYDAVYDFNGYLIKGKIPNKTEKLLQKWILIHREELELLWKISESNGCLFKIEPLK